MGDQGGAAVRAVRHVGSRPRGRIGVGLGFWDFCKKRGDTRLVLLQSVLGDKMDARGKTLRQIYAELLGRGDGMEGSRFPEIVGASNPSVNVHPAAEIRVSG